MTINERNMQMQSPSLAAMAMGLPQRPATIGQKFQHYKGGMYELLYLAMRDDGPTLMAVYCNANGQVFVRDAHQFFGYVDPDNKLSPQLRFKPWTEPKK